MKALIDKDKSKYKIVEVDKRSYKISIYQNRISISLCKLTNDGYVNIGKSFIIVRFEDYKFGLIIFNEILNDISKLKYLIKTNKIYDQEIK